MKPHRILKDFKGSQTGNDGPFAFVKGNVADLSDSLAAVAVKEGWAEPAEPKAAPVPAAKVPAEDAEAVTVDDTPVPSEPIETKVIEPEETKPAKAEAKKSGGKKK